jgi:peptidoglycan/xylan/chitin deacetylase (PgdA/CDA1 family)
MLLADYEPDLVGVRYAIPAMLELFARYDIHATWATVGFLFFPTRDELLASLPRTLPAYEDAALSPYPYLLKIGTDELTDPFHFGASLIECISQHPSQEIASHTFSHYYALAKGQDREAFRADLECAVHAADRMGFKLKSLVFPRNQENTHYLDICRDLGFTSYRGITNSLSYQASDAPSNAVVRGLRLADSYANLLGHHTYTPDSIAKQVPINLPGSRFLRPYTTKLKEFESLRLKRITDDLTDAARSGSIYHLWWHPENFGRNTGENMRFLEAVLVHFARLRREYHMTSQTMSETADCLLGVR